MLHVVCCAILQHCVQVVCCCLTCVAGWDWSLGSLGGSGVGGWSGAGFGFQTTPVTLGTGGSDILKGRDRGQGLGAQASSFLKHCLLHTSFSTYSPSLSLCLSSPLLLSSPPYSHHTPLLTPTTYHLLSSHYHLSHTYLHFPAACCFSCCHHMGLPSKLYELAFMCFYFCCLLPLPCLPRQCFPFAVPAHPLACTLRKQQTATGSGGVL